MLPKRRFERFELHNLQKNVLVMYEKFNGLCKIKTFSKLLFGMLPQH